MCKSKNKMLFFSIKYLFYCMIFIFAIYGIMSFNSNFLTNQESFVENDVGTPSDVQNEPIPEPPKSVQKVETHGDPGDPRDPVDPGVSSPKSFMPEELVDEISNKIEMNFNSLKESLATQMDSTKVMIDNSIKEYVNQNVNVNKNVVVENQVKETKKQNKLPTVRSFESEEQLIDVDVDVSDEDEGSEDGDDSDDDDEYTTETFKNSIAYQGVESPYCLNCHSF